MIIHALGVGVIIGEGSLNLETLNSQSPWSRQNTELPSIRFRVLGFKGFRVLGFWA